MDAIPWSCCNTTSLENDNGTEGACTTIYKRGCQHVVLNRTRSILLHVFLLTLCSVLLQVRNLVLGIFFTNRYIIQLMCQFQVSFIACTTCYARIYKDKMDRRKAAEIAKRSSLQEPDTKDVLLTHRSKYLHNSDNS